MSARRLGRLFGSVTLVASLVVVASAAADTQFVTSGIDWTLPALGSLLP
ncbi:hypothetical protein KBX50_09960 [Micromonospora sp. C51]|nr:hypothetical protein [Micromonospora sp. C51]MBQ1048778.1 hypothetical protein [Micromonospora sp. C51]